MDEKFPFDRKIPEEFQIAFTSAITKLRLETKFNDRGIDFSPIIGGLLIKDPGEIIPETDPNATHPKTGEPAKPEPILKSLKETEDWDDLRQFFTEKKGRKFYVLAERNHHPLKDKDERKDFLFLTETSEDGKISLFIFDYPNRFPKYGDNEKTPYLKLRLAAKIIDKEQKVIYFDNGEPNNLSIGLFPQDTNRDAVITEDRIFFKDPKNNSTYLETMGKLKIPIPTPNILRSVEYLLHLKQHLPELA